MKYSILILFFFFGCNQLSEKPKEIKVIQSSDSTNTSTIKIKEENLSLFPVENLVETIEFSKDAFLLDKLNYLPPIDLLSLLNYTDVPADNSFLKNSIEHFINSLTGAEGYKFDFTNDGKDDLIFISNYSSEGNYTALWEKSKNSYKFVKFFRAGLEKLFRSSKEKAYSLLFVSGFCCGSWVGDYTIYTPKKKNNEIDYKKTNNYSISMGLESPKFVGQLIRFKTLNDNYRLRLSPSSRDSVFFDEFDQYPQSNLISRFKIGSKGLAISLKEDSVNSWWFVIMDKTSKTTTDFYYEDEKSHLVGWMNSKYLERIENGL